MIRVVAAIIERRGRLLICQRRTDQPFAGQWEFPGGKMNPSETPRAALTRELREELAVQAQIGREIYRVQHRYAGMAQGVDIRFFHAVLEFGAPRNVCFQRIRWVLRRQLAEYKFLAADRGLVMRLARGEL